MAQYVSRLIRSAMRWFALVACVLVVAWSMRHRLAPVIGCALVLVHGWEPSATPAGVAFGEKESSNGPSPGP